MDVPSPVVVALGKSKLVLMLVLSSAFVIAGYEMSRLYATTMESPWPFQSLTFVHCAGVAAMVLFGTCTVVVIRKLFDSSPGLVLDERGLTDNSSAFSAGLIPWSNIAGFDVREIRGQRILYVMLKDPASYIGTLSPLRRTVLSAIKYLAPSPVGISANSLSIDFDELLPLANAQLSAHRQNA